MRDRLRNLAGKYGLFVGIGLVLLASAGVFFALRGQPRSPVEGGPTATAGGQPVPIAVGQPGPANPAVPGPTTGEPMPQAQTSPLVIRLSEGKPQPQAAAPLPAATGEPLPAEQVDAILKRLPELPGEAEAQADFKLALEPIPPPRPGETIEESFPPPPQAAPIRTTEAGPLKVLRYAPQGEIPTAPFVSVTFNQAMAPLATLEDLAAADVPVKIEPSLPGTWRWLGTRTLTFEYDSGLIDRLPKATQYRVTVPAGTQSAKGGALAEAVEWTFTTPPPAVVASYPYDAPQPLEPLFFVAFDQRISPAAVLETVRVDAGGQAVPAELASAEQVQADEKVKSLAGGAQEGRWLAFRLAKPLPADTPVTVTVGPGTPSAEGPLLTTESYSYSFRTYAPLQIVEHYCNWSGGDCPPLSPFHIRFNNPIDAAAYQESMLRVEPELPGAAVNIYGETIEMRGATQGQTTYTVVVSGELQDAFGQKLGQEARLTYTVGKAEPRLFGQEQIFITLDPAAQKAIFPVYAINYTKLDLKIYAVQPTDWIDFKSYLQNRYRTDLSLKPPGRLALEKTLRVEAAADSLAEVPIDLSPLMDGDFGHFIVMVEPPLPDPQERYYQTALAWVQVTQIGLDAFVDHSEMVAWATGLKDGAPLANVKVSALGGLATATTGQDGVARFPIPEGAAFLVASRGADTALLPRSPYPWDDGGWYRRPPSDELRWYVFDDRQMYRPGEEVHVKGWLRRIGGKQDGDVGLAGEALASIRYRIYDPQGNDLGGDQAQVNPLGGFDLAFKLPEAVNLGYARLELTAEGSLGGLNNPQYYHNFQIQEFRRPEFEVTARNETPPPYFAGEGAVVAVKAAYYAGGPLPDAEATWTVAASPGDYDPPGWPDYTFGTWEPWWWSYRPGMGEEIYAEYGGEGVQTYSGKTDAGGEHFLRLDFDGGEPRPFSVRAEASVMDVNRQAWSSATNLLVHPASLYVGLRSERYFVERGTPLEVQFIVTDLDGKPAADRPVEIRAARLEWKVRGGEWSEEEADVQVCKTGSQAEPGSCTFETPLGGTYRITAGVSDAQGRRNQTQLTRWVSGGQRPPARKVEQEEVTLIPDKESYQPGETARLLVQSPFSPAEGLLSVSRSGLLYTKRFRIEDGSTTLEVPVEQTHVPNLNVQVDLVGSAPRLDDNGEPVSGIPPRPAYATGSLNLDIPPLQRSLSLEVAPEESELEPGGETTIAVALKDARGQPVADAELAVVVVDEAILALSNYRLADPLEVFYATRPGDVSSHYARQSILLADPLALAQEAGLRSGEVAGNVTIEKEVAATESPAYGAYGGIPMPAAAPMPGAWGEADEAAPAPIRVRLDFNPLAAFVPSVRTGADGRASVPVKAPDNLTRYRVMVVAVDAGGRQFGSGEANITARLPLMARPSAPRFLNFGDQFELPVVLQNQTGAPLDVEVVVRAANLELTGNAGLKVSVPAHDRVEVRFPARAQMAGKAVIQVAAVAGSYADAATVELPVYTPATTEAFATYGVVDEGAIAQPVAAPTGVFPQYGGLEIDTSSTALQALTDAVLYLASYPYECSEQLASRILAIAALRDVLTAFQAEGLPSPQALEAAVERDIQRLQGMQNEDGGFPYWQRGRESIPINTIHAAHALQMARLKGFAVPDEMLSRAGEYLRQIEKTYPAWYDKETRWTLSAYALYVRGLMGDGDPDKAGRLLEQAGLENLPLDAVGWLWAALQDAPRLASQVEAIRRHVNNRVVETPGAANFTTAYTDQSYLLLSSDRRTDAILLDAMIRDEPASDLIPKLVNGLLGHTTKGRWASTQENVFVLLALDRYFNAFEAQTPDFVARIWLGEAYAGSHEYRGRTTERHETAVPMAYLVNPALGGGGTQDLILSKDGPGRLYYRLGLRYAPTDLKLDPLEMGFVVQRRYEALDDPADVRLDENGAWHIRAGARVRVRLTMTTDNRRYHVALADPLPAGLEIVNPALAVSGSVPQDPGGPDFRYGWWWWWTWYEHQNLRDERAEAFTPLLWEGVYEYSYIARATTPGTFVVPPAKAEEMYSPEVFGRSGSAVVIVK